MKTKKIALTEKPAEEITGKEMVSLNRAKEIMNEEAIEYTDEELKEILHFISKVVSITTANYERLKDKQAIVISINTNTTHETKSISLHSREYRRAG
jgi:ribosomal protein L17